MTRKIGRCGPMAGDSPTWRRLTSATRRAALLRSLLASGDEPLSPSQHARECNEPVGAIAYHMRVLHSGGVVIPVRRVERRGVYETFFRLTPAAAAALVADPDLLVAAERSGKAA